MNAVLRPPTPSTPSGGFLVRAESRGGRRLVLVPPAVLGVGLLAVWLLGLPLVVLPIVLAAAAAAGVALWPRTRVAFGWHPATLTLPDTALRLGQQAEIAYTRTSRRPREVAGDVLELTLVCQEKAAYQQGTERRVVHETVCSRAFLGSCAPGPDGIGGWVTVEIPLDQGCPSIGLGDNTVRWWLEARLRGAGVPGDAERFPVTVVPVLDPRVAGPPRAPVSPAAEPPPAAAAPPAPTPADPTLAISLEGAVVVAGDQLRGRLTRGGQLGGLVPAGGEARVRRVLLELVVRTEGRGTTYRNTVGRQEFPVDQWGRADGPFTLEVPAAGPISYDGRLIRVLWEVEARVDIAWGRDRRLRVPLLVVPRGGAGRYGYPHPLPPTEPA
jgi:hypothetical protein